MNKADFPILQEHVHGRPLVYLDNAATAQKPQQMLEAMQYAYTHFNANIHRGVHHLSQLATKEHENARRKIAEFINARSSNEIVFTKGTTDSINMLAFSFGEKYVSEGDEIIISSLEHHSNIVPWQMVCERKKAKLKIIPLSENMNLDITSFESMLNERTKIVSVAHVSNVLGIENPIKQIINSAHAHGIPVLIDAAQSVAHLPIDVQQLDCDFLVFSAHKIYGPTGLGVLYGKEIFLNSLPPAEGGGEMIEHVSFEKTTYNTLPYKFEAGTPDFIGSYSFARTIDYLQSIGLPQIYKYEQELIEYAEKQLSEIKGIRIYAAGQHKHGCLSFNVSGIHPYDIGMLLDQQGIAVRTGHHCAEPLMGILGVSGTVRISIALYNDKNDIDTFISGLSRAVSMLS